MAQKSIQRAKLAPRKRPTQRRSGQTMDAILEAAAHILVREGISGFTTNKIAEKAGVSIGSLYQYFPDKESILSEIARKHLDELERGINAITATALTAPVPVVVRQLIDDNIRAHLVDPRLHAVLTEHAPLLGRFHWQDEFGARVLARVRGWLEARRTELAAPDLDLAAYLLTRTVEACVHNGVIERPEDLRSGALARELTHMALQYLTAPRTAPKRSSAHGSHHGNRKSKSL